MLLFLIILSILFTGFVLLLGSSSTKEIADDWPKYRCAPTVMPFAGFYGHDTAENFQFCLKNIFQGQADSMLGPFTGILGTFIGTLSTLIQSANSMRMQMATLVGGVTNITKDFQDRITQIMFRIQITTSRMKMLISRMFATFYSIIFMGMSGITAVSNFGDTFLFGFLDTFCFPPETLIEIQESAVPVPISQVSIGHHLKPSGAEVTSVLKFYSDGQAMVKFADGTEVSTNHFMLHDGKFIQAGDHPLALPSQPWSGGLERPLFCLNTADHKLYVGKHIFLDYDETEKGDHETMKVVESQVNSKPTERICDILEYSPSIAGDCRIRLSDKSTRVARHVTLGTQLSTGKVVGVIKKRVKRICKHENEWIHESTLCWNEGHWMRAAQLYPVHEVDTVFYAFVVAPTATLELESGLMIRDYVEILSPETEAIYADKIASTS
jgi:hypothetical protein